MSTPQEKDKKKFIGFLDEKLPNVSIASREKLFQFAGLLTEATGRMGLVSRGDADRIYTRHLEESLAPALLAYLVEGQRVVDVGSGGGLPGIPLAIVRDDLEITLVEPRHRKAAFLEKSVLALGLRCDVVTASVDALGRRYPDRRWDTVVSRGLRWTRPMVKVLAGILEPDGTLIRYGDPALSVAGVEVSRLEGPEPRAIQRWPQETWADLPEAR